MEQLATVGEGLVQQAEGMWPRHSSSNLMAPLQPGNVLLPHERIAVNSAGNLWTGYVYNVFLNGVDKGWIPFNPNTFAEPLQFAYSILVEDLTVGIEESKTTNTVSIYPNPGNGEVGIVLNSMGKNTVSVRVMDAQGRSVLEQTLFRNHTAIDLRNLNPGHYTISVFEETATTHLPYIKL